MKATLLPTTDQPIKPFETPRRLSIAQRIGRALRLVATMGGTANRRRSRASLTRTSRIVNLMLWLSMVGVSSRRRMIPVRVRARDGN